MADWRDYLDSYGPLVLLSVGMLFMVWIRSLASENTFQESSVLFSGNDPWYHLRTIRIVVDHFPATQRFDPWSQFPFGTGRHSGFGGLFDQLIALASIIVGGGSPSPHLVEVVTAYAPAVFGAATAIPVYLIVKEVTDRWGGILTVGFLALASGQFLSRTVVGSADHQSAEAFFGSLAVLGFIYVITTAYSEKPVIEDLGDRNWIVLRKPIFAGILGGVAIAAYLMMWPPGVMIVFTMGVFVIIQLVRDHLSDTPTDYLALSTVLTMGIAGGMTLLYTKSLVFKSTAFSLLQPFVPFGVAIGAVVLFVVSRYFDREGVDRQYYPIGVVVLVVASFGIAAVVFPRAIVLFNGLISRAYSFGLLTSPGALTVAEIQPGDLSTAWRAFGPVFYVAVLGLVLLAVRCIRRNQPVDLMVLLWSLNIFSAYFTMVRFGYYLAANVAVLAGITIWWVSRDLLSLDTQLKALDEIKAYQIIGVLVILVVVVPGNVVAVQDRQPVWESADRLGGTDTAWHNELSWMKDNTPEEPLEYTKLYESPEDGDFAYPPDAYGVISWWDYGHWITTQGRRIPVANPFQQGAGFASAYLQAESEERANLMLEARPALRESDNQVQDLSNDDLRGIVESESDQHAGEDTRYVVIDDQMVGGKFPAIATWTGPGYQSYLSRQEFSVQGQQANLIGVNEEYRNIIMVRLYFQDAVGLSHYRLVHETTTLTTFASVAQRTPSGYESTNIINRPLSRQIFSLVQQRQDLAFYDTKQAPRVKTYERVPGATLTGTANVSNETSVTVSLQLETNAGRNTTYFHRTTTDEDGSFSITVPYSTDNAVSPADGGTDIGVTANGNYTVAIGSILQPSEIGSVEVPETAVYSGREIQITLEDIPERPPPQDNQTTTNQSVMKPPEIPD